MTTQREPGPGEARVLNLRPGTRCLIHRPGARAIYLVYEEDRRQKSVEPVGTFASWAAALYAAKARSGPSAA